MGQENMMSSGEATDPGDGAAAVAAAAASDPVALGWMQGFPPPAAVQVRRDDSSLWRFPQLRWSYSHWQELLPSAAVRRAGPVTDLPETRRDDIDAIRLTPLGASLSMSWAESLAANYTDAIVVLHRGSVVYERYFGAGGPARPHIAFSVTKSFVGTIAEMLIDEGRLDPAAPMAALVPELGGSGFGDATLRQVLDMRTAIAFDETYGGADGDIARMSMAIGAVPRPAGYAGPDGLYAHVQSLGRNGDHGGNFVYRTVNTNALGWALERLAGIPIAAQIEARFWAPMGMEADAALQVDGLGTGFSGGGFVPGLRDMARFGEMLRLGGEWRGRRIVPATVVAAIAAGGDTAAFAHTQYPGLPRGSYASQWWHRGDGPYMAMGVHGQTIFIHPAAEMVIARFGSHPVASNRGINPVTAPAFDALAAHLARTG
jgi:hypothetical protein